MQFCNYLFLVCNFFGVHSDTDIWLRETNIFIHSLNIILFTTQSEIRLMSTKYLYLKFTESENLNLNHYVTKWTSQIYFFEDRVWITNFFCSGPYLSLMEDRNFSKGDIVWACLYTVSFSQEYYAGRWARSLKFTWRTAYAQPRLNRIQTFPFHGVTRPLRFATFLLTLSTTH